MIGGASFTINELGGDLGITPRAIRFYESKGLIAPARMENGNRTFTHRDRARLLLILRGQRLGFTLADIREYLDLYDADPMQREQVRHLLAKVGERIADLERHRRDLEQALAELRDIEGQARAALAGRTAGTPAAAD